MRWGWAARMTGRVLRSRGGVYEVETEEGTLEARLRGRLKREQRTGERVVVGDQVDLERSGDGDWTIERVHERKSALVRRAPGKAPRPKVIAANVDQVVIVFATQRPAPHLRMLDRFLVLTEASGLEALIVVNKVDLTGIDKAKGRFAPYEAIGYPVLFTAAATGIGVESLRAALRDRISTLTGPSGVGKSSLLNAVQPGLALRVASVGEAALKGRHTTVNAQLIPLECGGYVADTPGLRELGLWGVDAAELDRCFPEFAPFLGSCRYAASCTHSHEPGCGVQDAVKAGAVHPARYDSYLRMLGEEEE